MLSKYRNIFNECKRKKNVVVFILLIHNFSKFLEKEKNIEFKDFFPFSHLLRRIFLKIYKDLILDKCYK